MMALLLKYIPAPEILTPTIFIVYLKLVDVNEQPQCQQIDPLKKTQSL